MKKGFSLVELLVVIGIIAILAGILFSSFSGGTESAQAAKCLNNMRNIAQAYVRASAANGEEEDEPMYLPTGSYVQTAVGGYIEWIGWISWDSRSDPYNTRSDTGEAVKSFIHVPSISAYTTDSEAATFAITNGTIWAAMHKDRSAYVCPLHKKYRHQKGWTEPNWSYVMSAWPAYDSKAGSGPRGLYKHFYPDSRAERRLILAELHFDEQGSESDGDTSSDAVLQYKASYHGKDYHSDSSQDDYWNGTAESIAFNHRSGKRDYFAHVAFMDGHTEKLKKPKDGSGLTDEQLTALLCGACDVTFDGQGYSLVNGGDEFTEDDSQYN